MKNYIDALKTFLKNIQKKYIK